MWDVCVSDDDEGCDDDVCDDVGMGVVCVYVEIGCEEDEEGDAEALLREIFEDAGVDARWIVLEDDEDVEILGIVNDVNVLLSGDLFVCGLV